MDGMPSWLSTIDQPFPNEATSGVLGPAVCGLTLPDQAANQRLQLAGRFL